MSITVEPDEYGKQNVVTFLISGDLITVKYL